MRYRPSSASQLAFAGAAALLLLATVAARPDTAAGPTCAALEQKCLKHVAGNPKAPKIASDGVARPHMTDTECYDSYHKAEDTGVWPEHLPFNFAIACTP